MADLTPGTRVWFRTEGGIAHGTVSRVFTVSDVNSDELSVLIVLDDVVSVVIVSTTTRGTLWDLLGDVP